MKLIIHLFLGALGVMIAAYLVPGVVVESFFAALVFAVVLGVINIFIKPLIIILTLPINVLTLGLFSFVINALLVMMAAYLVPGFTVGGFLSALLFAVVLSLINIIFGMLGKK
jgi:putative membrane protein